MYIYKKTKVIAYSLFCAGTVGLLCTTTVFAHESDADHAQVKTQSGQDSELSNRINRFNESGGSLEGRGATDANLDEDTRMPADSDTPAKHPKADELSEEIKQYNENRGSLKENSAARSGATGSTDSATEAGANASSNGGSNAESRELSNEIDEYNKNSN